jgi:hypothetical protein
MFYLIETRNRKLGEGEWLAIPKLFPTKEAALRHIEAMTYPLPPYAANYQIAVYTKIGVLALGFEKVEKGINVRSN